MVWLRYWNQFPPCLEHADTLDRSVSLDRICGKAQRFINGKTEVWATDSIPAPKPAARPHLRVAAIVRSTAVDHHGSDRKIMKAPAVRRNDQRRQRKGYQQCPQQRSRQTERLRI